MSERFFEDPILNNPYEKPQSHWELDEEGCPTQKIIKSRRESRLITPIPKPKRRGGKEEQRVLEFGAQDLSKIDQQYEVTQQINWIRSLVDEWRKAPEDQWKVTPETARLLKHWRHHEFQGITPFFCQIEAAETAIWLTEVAPEIGKRGKNVLEKLGRANDDANPGLFRIALKLATGAGKTTVMAMLIAWQTINAARRPASSRFTKGFLVVTPGITIRDRLRVLQPNDTESYFKRMQLVPQDLAGEIGKARIVITNYHAFRKRELMDLAKTTRQFLEGHGSPMQTIETEGQMLQRVISELMAMNQILVINDEAHHCYREKPNADDEEKVQLSSEENAEAKSNREAARMWISGIEAVSRKIGKGQQRVIDLSATPFFLASSGYREGTLFPWTASDFSLMDAIESGIVKLPRVPVADNISKEVPFYRELWKNIKKQMPKQGRGKSGQNDPDSLPTKLKSAIEALYNHYEATFEQWTLAGFEVPPCFIVVCNNTTTSKLVYDYLSGYEIQDENGDTQLRKGACPLFSNYDNYDAPLPRPKTLLIDSEQLESGEALDSSFREIAGPEIEQFRREIIERDGYVAGNSKLSDSDLLREVMNTVGKPGKLGAGIRCVVSVAMLTEGWDTNTVTHVLGVRAFSTQLLCEQVVGRALRRQNYTLNPYKTPATFDVEYADILGIPFDFTAQAVRAPVTPPPQTIKVKAISPDRDKQEISFPNVIGYRVELPDEEVKATFTEDHHLVLDPDLVGPAITSNQGIIGEGVQLTLERTKEFRKSSVILHLATHLVKTKYKDGDGIPRTHLILNIKKVVRDWLDQCLECRGGTNHGQLLLREMADMACECMLAAIVISADKDQKVLAIIDPYNSKGSTMRVNFNTTKTLRWQTDSRRCHVNWAICDSGWEQEFARVLDTHLKVKRWVKNQSLGFEVPYQMGGVARKYIPDFIVVVDDGKGDDDLLNLVCEVKGYRGEDAREKKNTMDTYWVPGVNNTGKFGRWAFAEFKEVFAMQSEFSAAVEDEISKVLDTVVNMEVN